MKLAMDERGRLEDFIDRVRKNTPDLYEDAKLQGASKEQSVWYIKGYIYGSFLNFFHGRYHRKPYISEEKEIREIIGRRMNEFFDVVTDI